MNAWKWNWMEAITRKNIQEIMERSRLERYNDMQRTTVKHIMIDWIKRLAPHALQLKPPHAREARRPNIGFTCNPSLARNLHQGFKQQIA